MKALRLMALAAWALGCAEIVEHPVRAHLAVSRTACNGRDFAAGASGWRLRVLMGATLQAEQAGQVVDGFPAEVEIPDGADVTVRLEVFEGTPGMSRLVAWGQSRTVTADEPREELFLTVPLAPPEQFVDLCVRLARARGGHTATRLADGKVVLVGGTTGGANPSTHDSLELLDPYARTVETSGSLTLITTVGSIVLAIEDQAAVPYTPSQVLLWGGRSMSPGGKVSTSLVAVWDAEVQKMGVVPPSPEASVARFGHTLIREGNEFFALGGLTGAPASPLPVAEIELVDEGGRRSVAGLLSPSLAFSAVSGSRLGAVVAGGESLATGEVSSSVQVLRLGRTVQSRWSGLLATPRARATAFPLGDGVLIAGGVDGNGQAIGTTEWLRDGSPPRLVPGPAILPRETPCAAPLGDGRVLLLGGVANGQLSNAAELLSPDGTATPVDFPGPPRRAHTCTTLADGSVLVTGGLTTGDDALGDVWRYLPAPPP
ncbi:MAG: kelch repeat-containing protein [Myxococcota bacterium]